MQPILSMVKGKVNVFIYDMSIVESVLLTTDILKSSSVNTEMQKYKTCFFFFLIYSCFHFVAMSAFDRVAAYSWFILMKI